MIPHLRSEHVNLSVYEDFCAELHARGFAGDVATGIADRTGFAPGNSNYHWSHGAVADEAQAFRGRSLPRKCCDILPIPSHLWRNVRSTLVSCIVPKISLRRRLCLCEARQLSQLNQLNQLNQLRQLHQLHQFHQVRALVDRKLVL